MSIYFDLPYNHFSGLAPSYISRLLSPYGQAVLNTLEFKAAFVPRSRCFYAFLKFCLYLFLSLLINSFYYYIHICNDPCNTCFSLRLFSLFCYVLCMHSKFFFLLLLWTFLKTNRVGHSQILSYLNF